jgi:hypothetical protein
MIIHSVIYMNRSVMNNKSSDTVMLGKWSKSILFILNCYFGCFYFHLCGCFVLKGGLHCKHWKIEIRINDQY